MQQNQVKDTITLIENELINKLFEYFKTGQFQLTPMKIIELYSKVQIAADKSDFNCENLLDYFTQVIENYIIKCKKELIGESKSNLIDGFLLHTKNIYFLIYWMIRVFTYLDCFYTKAIMKTTLSEIAMNLYKTNFYEEFKNNIQSEINNLKNEEKNGNEGLNLKIQSIMKILEDVKLLHPKIVRDRKDPEKQIFWIEKELFGRPNSSYY